MAARIIAGRLFYKGVIIIFSAYDFIFDGIPGEQYGLKLYNFDSASQDENSPLGISPEILEDRIGRRISPIHYGISFTNPLSFQIVFGSDTPLDRYDISVITSWLIGHQDYKWLGSLQPDLYFQRYKCTLQDAKVVTIAGLLFALQCDVLCDSPFSYSYPELHVSSINKSGSIQIYNPSTMNFPYYPNIKIENITSSTIEMYTDTEPDRKLIFSKTSGVDWIEIAGESHIITSNAPDIVYSGCNFKFLRLAKGDNMITIIGNCDITITCEFPMGVGS